MESVLDIVREELDVAWGDVLDAGTGRSSLAWLQALPCRSRTAVTAEPGRAEVLLRKLPPQPGDRLLVGNWIDPELLAGEQFDQVVADYLLGSCERYAPAFETDLLRRLASMTRSELICCGLEPYRTRLDPGHWLCRFDDFRTACHRLCGQPSHRELPREWVERRLAELGFARVLSEQFELDYEADWVQRELDGLAGMLRELPDRGLRRELERRAAELRREGLRRTVQGASDWLVVARP